MSRPHICFGSDCASRVVLAHLHLLADHCCQKLATVLLHGQSPLPLASPLIRFQLPISLKFTKTQRQEHAVRLSGLEIAASWQHQPCFTTSARGQPVADAAADLPDASLRLGGSRLHCSDRTCKYLGWPKYPGTNSRTVSNGCRGKSNCVRERVYGQEIQSDGSTNTRTRRGTKRDTCPAKLRRGFNVGPVVQQYSSDGVVASLRLSTKHKSHRRNDVSDERTHDNNKDSMPCVFDNNIRVCVPQESTV